MKEKDDAHSDSPSHTLQKWQVLCWTFDYMHSSFMIGERFSLKRQMAIRLPEKKMGCSKKQQDSNYNNQYSKPLKNFILE